MFETYTKLNATTKALFADIANKLIATNYLARDKKDNKDSYHFVISYKELFEEYLAVLGYQLIIDRGIGAIQLYNEAPSTHLKLKRDETLVLLILRLLYQDKLKETTLNTNILITTTDIHEKYELLEIKKKITKTDLQVVLRLFKKYNLLEPLGDITKADTKIVIYPTITQAITTLNISEVVATITKLVEEGERSEKVNEDTTN